MLDCKKASRNTIKHSVHKATWIGPILGVDETVNGSLNIVSLSWQSQKDRIPPPGATFHECRVVDQSLAVLDEVRLQDLLDCLVARGIVAVVKGRL